MDLQQQIVELREKFLKKLEDESPNEDIFHPNDIARITTKDDWLRRWLEQTDNNIQESLTLLWGACEWRKKVGANEINEDNVKRQYLEDGVFFKYGHDKDGKPLLVVKLKLHVKSARDTSELLRCVIYWFERLERETNGDQISLFFDMCEGGLSNMDMELTKYLINLFKLYYPNFLNYIILLELPWVLTAAIKIIKTMLPPKGVAKMKQVNKSTLKEFVDPSVALKCWGGQSDWIFNFEPEVRNSLPSEMNGKVGNKKVRYAESSPLNEQAAIGFGDQSTDNSMLSITPDIITFNKDGQELTASIVLKNKTADKCLSYKVKTTAPEKFRVRRSTGILLSEQQVTVSVSLQPGFTLRTLLQNDKFLVLCLPMKDPKMTSEELREFWKTNGESAEQHRVWCRNGVTEPTSILSATSSNNDRTTESLYTKITHLEECHSKIHKELRTLKYVMMLSIIWTVVAAIVIVYIVRSDIEQVMSSEQSCQIHRG